MVVHIFNARTQGFKASLSYLVRSWFKNLKRKKVYEMMEKRNQLS